MSEMGEAPKKISIPRAQPPGSIVRPFTGEPTVMRKDVGVGILDRDTPLTIEEIAKIRSANVMETFGRFTGRQYTINDNTVGVWNYRPTDFQNKDENREIFRFEHLLINALVEQLRIAQAFGLPQSGMYLDLKLDYGKTGGTLANANGYFYIEKISDQINFLKAHGATEEQIITELSGHILHEAVHRAGEKKEFSNALLNGEASLGEITTVTAQTAYYLEKNYTGPRSYDRNRFRNGLKKIQNGETNDLDYDIATCTGATLLRRSLQETYPALAEETKDMDSYTACQAIVAIIPSEEREKLIPTLKKAIVQSADPAEFQSVLGQLKEEKPDDIIN